MLSTDGFSDLSVREMLVLEAVAAAEEQNSMSAIHRGRARHHGGLPDGGGIRTGAQRLCAALPRPL